MLLKRALVGVGKSLSGRAIGRAMTRLSIRRTREWTERRSTGAERPRVSREEMQQLFTQELGRPTVGETVPPARKAKVVSLSAVRDAREALNAMRRAG